jgi:heme exporter protein B
MINALRFIFLTELRLLWRHSQEWLYPIGFFILVISLFPLAFSPDPQFLKTYVPGCIWLAALLSSLLAIENVFLSDREDQHLEQLLLSQIPLSLILLSKLCAQWLVTELPLILLIPIFSIWFNLSLPTTYALCISLLLGTPILTLIGSMGVALTLGLRQQGILLSLLFLPLVTPVLIFGVSIVQQAQSGLTIAGPIAFLAGLTLLAITFLPIVIAATLRVSMDD